MAKSAGERLFSLQLADHNVDFVREYRFSDRRRFRFDFAIIEPKIAIEIEGGVYSRGRHVRPIGFINDCEKYNLAAKLKWRVFRFPTQQVNDKTAIMFLRDILEECGLWDG